MSNVIQFEDHFSRKPVQLTPTQRNKVNAIRNALRSKSIFNAHDQKTAARNLHALLEDLQSSGAASKLQIVDRMGLRSNPTDSTKRLEMYTLPDPQNTKRISRLVKNPDKYFEFSRAISDLTDQSEELCLFQIFSGCDFGSSTKQLAEDQDADWIHLASQLEDLAAAMVVKNRLTDYWNKVIKLNAAFDVRSDEFLPSPFGLWIQLEGAGLASSAICSDEAPPCPSIVLGRILQERSFDGDIWLDDGSKISVRFLPWLEVRFALAPGVKATKLTGLLEFRTVLEAKDNSNKIYQFDNPHTDGSNTVKFARSVNDHVNVDYLEFNEQDAPPPQFREGCDHSYFEWRAITPNLLREVFDPESSEFIPTISPVTEHSNWPYTRFVSHSAAGKIEASILSGSLESELSNRCRGLQSALDEYLVQYDKLVLEQEVNARQRWASLTEKDEAK